MNHRHACSLPSAPAALPDTALGQRLLAWQPDSPDAALPFSLKLQRTNGWSPGFTRRVVEEYRRFLYLTQKAGHTVCPSDAVDQAWHLHMLHSRDYWEDFCPAVLGRPLHHQPSLGGPQEQAHYRNLYHATLASYERIFGTLPPPDIWPDANTRFAICARHVDAARCWIVPKPRWLHRPLAWLPALLLAALLPACSVVDAAAPGGLPGPAFARLYAMATALLAVLAAAGIWQERRRARQEVEHTPGRHLPSMTQVGIYGTAWLAGGKERVVHVALTRLLQAGSLQVVAGGLLGFRRRLDCTAAALAADAHPIERAICSSLRTEPDAAKLARLWQSPGTELAAAFDQLQRELQALELLAGPASGTPLTRPGFWLRQAQALAWALLAIGGIRLGLGLLGGRPVAYLVMLLLLNTGLLVLCIHTQRAAAMPVRGRAYLQYMRTGMRRTSQLGLRDPLLLTAVALYGSTAMAAHSGLGELRSLLQRSQDSSDGGGDSGGGDGGGCGGGCGG